MRLIIGLLMIFGAVMNLAAGDLSVAREALKDGLWRIARQQAETEDSLEARLIVIESYANEDRWEDVRAELSSVSSVTNSPQLDFYRAVVDGRTKDAIALLKSSGAAIGVGEAKMMEADLLFKAGDVEGARKLWKETLESKDVSERAFASAAMNLADIPAMRRAYGSMESVELRRSVGLRLGRALLGNAETAVEGETMIRSLVRAKPDAEEAMESFLSLASKAARDKRWKDAVEIYADAIETWPEATKDSEIQEGYAEAFMQLGRYEESLAAFIRVEHLSTDDSSKARSILRQGDALAELGRGAESLAKYRTVLELYPTTSTALAMKRILSLREREMQGRDLYKAYKFEEARRVFLEISEADPARHHRMAFFEVLCLYGLGRDDLALMKAKALAESDESLSVKAEATLWLAKLYYNRSEWKESARWFTAYVDLQPTSQTAPEALLWAARATIAVPDYQQAICIVTRLAEEYPLAPALTPAVLVQAEALIAQARYDEALLVLDRIAAAPETSRTDRLDARLLKANALFAMGADNPARFEGALAAYRELRFSEELTPEQKMTVGFKTGRVLEKLKRFDEALDTYFSQVVCVYQQGIERGESFGDEARGAFSRTAFRMAEIFQDRGKVQQAVAVLKLVATSDVPASREAEKRINELYKKGLFL